MKIPWKNLYSAPVEAAVENLYLLVVPNTEINYDPVKEEKWRQDSKQAEINKVEEAKKQEREKSEFLFCFVIKHTYLSFSIFILVADYM